MAYDKSKYSEKLRDPRWQKKRLEVFERDEWTCQACMDDSRTLNVHHKIYLRGRDPWDYPTDLLITLCQDCHEQETVEMKEAETFFIEAFKRNFLSKDLLSMAEKIQTMELQHQSEVIASVYAWAFTDPEIQKELIDRYFEFIKKKD